MQGSDYTLLLDLGFIVIGAAAFAFLGKLVRMPSIVAYIFAGIFLGPVLGLVEIGHSLELIAEVGIALLLFLVGLELSFAKIRDVGRVAVAAGVGQVVFTAAGGIVICLLLGFDLIASVFLAVALTFSSTVVVVKLLDQKGHLNRLYGRMAVGIFLVQDLIVILVLTLLAGLGHGDGLAFGTVALGLGKAFGGMALLLGIVLLASKYLLPRPFAWAARSPDTIFIWALFWCFLVAGLAGILDLSLEIGAFLAGIALAQLPYNDDLRRRLHPLMSFFIAVFFVTLGVQMDLSAARENALPAAVLSLFVIIGNPLIFMFIISRMNYSEWNSFQTSITVAQISEFSFIFAALGFSSGMITQDVLSIVAVVGIVTITVSAYMILYSDLLYRVCRRLRILRPFRAKQTPDDERITSRLGHVIVVGMNQLGVEIVQGLVRRGELVLAVDTDPAKLLGLDGAEVLIGNVEYESVVEEIGMREAKLVVSALQIEDTNHLLAYRCRKLGVPCSIHAFDVSVVDDLMDLETSYLLMPNVDGLVEQRDILEKEGLVGERPTSNMERPTLNIERPTLNRDGEEGGDRV
jgi:Kef-type K+ transport system membrane component KefB